MHPRQAPLWVTVLACGVVSTETARAEPMITVGVQGRVLEIAPSDIVDMDISESGGITDIFLRLMPGATAAFAQLTEEETGRRMTLNMCGVTMLEAVIRDRIASGTIYVAGTTMIRAEAMRALWHGRASCDTLDAEVFEHGQ